MIGASLRRCVEVWNEATTQLISCLKDSSEDSGETSDGIDSSLHPGFGLMLAEVGVSAEDDDVRQRVARMLARCGCKTREVLDALGRMWSAAEAEETRVAVAAAVRHFVGDGAGCRIHMEEDQFCRLLKTMGQAARSDRMMVEVAGAVKSVAGMCPASLGPRL